MHRLRSRVLAHLEVIYGERAREIVDSVIVGEAEIERNYQDGPKPDGPRLQSCFKSAPKTRRRPEVST